LTILNVFQTISTEIKPDGAINRMQTQTPSAQLKLISLEDFLLMILRINGMFHNGRVMAAIRPMVWKNWVIGGLHFL
jgi:hypothetical protein